MPNSSPMQRYVEWLVAIFERKRDKHEAQAGAREPMIELAADRAVLGEVLARHVSAPGSLRAANYPVLAFTVASNPWFELVANAWIPHPDGETDLSTKAIHHHGELLLTTATAFGPGYEHWMFEPPTLVDPDRGLFRTRLLERERHGSGEAAFVDAYVAHLPMFPPAMSITYCLWTSRTPRTWKDTVKRVSVVQRNSTTLRAAVTKARLAKALDIKTVEYFDFTPSPEGFVGMKDREEFERGPNAHHLQSLCHVLQQTGNEHLAPVLRERAYEAEDSARLSDLVGRLERGEPIEGRLSPAHYTVAHANFTSGAIEEALLASAALAA